MQEKLKKIVPTIYLLYKMLDKKKNHIIFFAMIKLKTKNSFSLFRRNKKWKN